MTSNTNRLHVIDDHLCFHAFVECSFDVLSRCFRFHYNTKEASSVEIFSTMFLDTSVDKTAAKFVVIPPSSLTSMEYIHVVVLMHLHSLSCLSRVRVACNYECRVVLDVFVLHVSIVNVTWVEALDLLHLGFFSDSSSFGFSLCRAPELLSSLLVLDLLPSSRPCSSSCLF